MRAPHKDVRCVLRRLRPECEVGTTGGGHVRIQLGSAVVFMSSTPGDRRSLKNTVAYLRRAGMLQEEGSRCHA